jgi:fatty-acyl-CoA synthase/long-chain acyl-CoA synthetase
MQTAASAIGAIVVPVNVRYRRDELAYILRTCTPKLVVSVSAYNGIDYERLLRESASESEADPIFVFTSTLDIAFTGSGTPPVESARRTMNWTQLISLGSSHPGSVTVPDAADPVLMQFTSGTTAFPKAALLSSRATLGATWFMAQRMRITEADIYFSTQPLYHVGGSVASVLLPLCTGATVVIPERYSPEAVFSLLPRYRCTVRTGQAAMYAMELAHPDFTEATYTTLRAGWGGGAPGLKRAIRDRMGIPVLTSIYGLTETAGTTTISDALDPEAVWVETCGRAIPGVEVGILVEDTVQVAAGVVGEICIRGWSLMVGYFDDPVATGEAIDSAGWFHTGDIGTLDQEGNLRFVDRLKDMIKPGGENVSAGEVERVVAELPGVAHVAVVGRPDARLGQVPVAFVEMRRGVSFDADAIIAHCQASMASFKVPREIYLTTKWPTTESGKILKRELGAGLPEFRPIDGSVGGSG